MTNPRRGIHPALPAARAGCETSTPSEGPTNVPAPSGETDGQSARSRLVPPGRRAGGLSNRQRALAQFSLCDPLVRLCLVKLPGGRHDQQRPPAQPSRESRSATAAGASCASVQRARPATAGASDLMETSLADRPEHISRGNLDGTEDSRSQETATCSANR